jgi:anti-sigma B factor antagonist
VNKKEPLVMEDIKEDGGKVILKVAGRIDMSSATALEKKIDSIIAQGVKDLTIDLGEVPYLSSAGLRVMLKTQKQISSFGVEASFEIINVQPAAKEVFDMTGFSDFLVIKNKKIEEEMDYSQPGANEEE